MKQPQSIAANRNSKKTQLRTSVGGSKRMFSAASFFDVIEAGISAQASELGEPSAVPESPAIVAFYGFRGGAGRTLALAHVAVLLAQRGLRVGAVDFDLEAPGLHVALGASVASGDDKGLVPLLHSIIPAAAEQSVNVLEHLQVISPREGVGKILLLPAGRVTRKYLAQIEELGLGLWQESEQSPIERILDGLKMEKPDVILIDCRTGFSGMSASVLFHHADLAVIFLPLSEQIWDGVDMLLMAVAAARTKRAQKPGLLFVPSMVPPGDTGQEKIKRYLSKLNEHYDRFLLNKRVKRQEEEDDEDALESDPWLREGIGWDARISSDGAVRQPFMPGGPWGLFQGLCDKIVESLDLGLPQRAEKPVQTKAILNELKISGSIGFAEELSEDEMQRFMVPSASVKASVDRNSTLIVGAKGSGKTLLWRYLVEQNSDSVLPIPSDTRHVVGHPPRLDLDPQKISLSADAFKELEQVAKMCKASTHKAFWLFYALLRLSRASTDIGAWLRDNMPSPLKGAWQKLTTGSPDFASLLSKESVSTIVETVFSSLDDWLVNQSQQYVLVYDGLDNGFSTGKPEVWYERRERFVTGLLQVVADWRSRLKRIQFKVFLREDIYLNIELQNRSHLDATKHELRFGPADLWQLALKIADTSPTYKSMQSSTRMNVDGLYLGEEGELKVLLYPLWGRTIEKGKRAYTANYILKRTSDAQGRLFPRTFIQMLDKAVQFENKQELRSEPDRVLRFRSLRQGVVEASKQRTDDLRTEYIELKPYLEALSGAPAVATAAKLKAVMKGKIGRPEVPLHLGAGGWSKVFNQLITVGVLSKKPGDAGEEEKYRAALIYRDGLGMRSPGLQ
jgi:MinD-like ATPase involved in chromosome partitioning or flagellar assembly